MRTLYWISGSGPCWKVMLFLELNNIDYQSIRFDNAKKEQKSESFLRLSPRGQVPVMVDGDLIVRQSPAILAYLDRAYMGDAFFGIDAQSVALIQETIANILDNIEPGIQKIVQPIFRNRMESSMEQINEGLATTCKELALLEGILKQNTWLTGDDVRAADIHLLPSIERLVRATSRQLPDGIESFDLFQAYPILGAWLKRFRDLPAYDASYPPHWRTS